MKILKYTLISLFFLLIAVTFRIFSYIIPTYKAELATNQVYDNVFIYSIVEKLIHYNMQNYIQVIILVCLFISGVFVFKALNIITVRRYLKRRR